MGLAHATTVNRMMVTRARMESYRRRSIEGGFPYPPEAPAASEGPDALDTF